jgi:hypothetical protein
MDDSSLMDGIEVARNFRPAAKESRFLRLCRATKVASSMLVSALSRSWFAVPLFGFVTAICVDFLFHANDDVSGGGEPFALLDGISIWPGISLFIFAGFLSWHFILKSQRELRENAKRLTERFALEEGLPEKNSWFGWDAIPVKEATGFVDMTELWKRYLFRGRFSRRLFRVFPMAILYMLAVYLMGLLLGGYSNLPIRGDCTLWPYVLFLTICSYVVLTFFVVDSTLLHCGFLKQLRFGETYWPDKTFEKSGYESDRDGKKYIPELSRFWDVQLISERTEAVGNLIYYPFVILLFIILAHFPCFDNWPWTPALIVTLFMHFLLALFAAWNLPKVAVAYRDSVLAELNLRKRKAFMVEGKTPEAIGTMIEEVESNHKGAFAYLWEQPAIRALLLPSGGIGLATLWQYLPH